MAEFQEVCRQWRRMCDKHTCSRNKDAFTGLPICPIAAKHEGYPCDEDPIDWTEKATKQLEEIVMSWAAEHPEPVYPKWSEWIETQYLQTRKEVEHGHEPLSTWMLTTRIPADIAEKLGIEPKEG